VRRLIDQISRAKKTEKANKQAKKENTALGKNKKGKTGKRKEGKIKKEK